MAGARTKRDRRPGRRSLDHLCQRRRRRRALRQRTPHGQLRHRTHQTQARPARTRRRTARAAIALGSERSELFPTVQLQNAADLPPNALGNDSIEILWTIDGSDPLKSDTAFPVLFDKGATDSEQSLPMVVASFLRDAEELQIRAVARANNARVLEHSEEVSLKLKLVR